MLKVKLFCVLLLALSFKVTCAQKLISKTWELSKFQDIEIHSNLITSLEFFTTNDTIIKAVLEVEGEAKEAIFLEDTHRAQTLVLKTAYNPLYIRHDDKLAAHKVLSCKMQLQLPDNFSLNIQTPMASLNGRGRFNTINCRTEDTPITLQIMSGNGTLFTRTGPINLHIAKGIKVVPTTQKGEVQGINQTYGNYYLKVNTYSGTIKLHQLKN